MDEYKRAIARVANANRRYRDAFDELQQATESLSLIVAEEQNNQWQEITLAPQEQERRPKGEIQEIITNIFQNPIPRPLSFPEIIKAVNLRISNQPSQSTIRQTLYRMRKNQMLESYSGKWSRGAKLQRKSL